MICKSINIRKILIRLFNNIHILISCRSSCCSCEETINTCEQINKPQTNKRKLPKTPNK